MLLRLSMALLLGVGGQGVKMAIPDTPAGHALYSWQEAVNSGDISQITAYIHKYQPQKSSDMMLTFSKMSGGFELLEIMKSEPLHLEFLARERRSTKRVYGKIDVKDGKSEELENFQLQTVPPGASASEINSTVDPATRGQVIDAAISNLNQYYVEPDLAKQMEEDLRARQKRGEFDSATDGQAFAALLTSDLREVSHDKHLRVNFSSIPFPKTQPGEDPDDLVLRNKELLGISCGFEKIEILGGNIGYLKFDMFPGPEVCGRMATAAMNFLANARAIIFDLRDNGGGEPEMIALISSYLFPEPTHLNDIWERKGNVTHQYWTLPYVPGDRLDDKPAFVLTSNRTFSGAEEFAYDLKALKRATIVGETTGGGAHPVASHMIGDHFMIGVPFAKAINPISKTNWEGSGVEPDVKVPAADALSTAQKLAMEKMNAPE